jgi:hypothetical protein
VEKTFKISLILRIFKNTTILTSGEGEAVLLSEPAGLEALLEAEAVSAITTSVSSFGLLSLGRPVCTAICKYGSLTNQSLKYLFESG